MNGETDLRANFQIRIRNAVGLAISEYREQSFETKRSTCCTSIRYGNSLEMSFDMATMSND
jgi:hypothetical protein